MYNRILRIAPRFRRARLLVVAILITVVLVQWMLKDDWNLTFSRKPVGFSPPRKEASLDAGHGPSIPEKPLLVASLRVPTPQTHSIARGSHNPSISRTVLRTPATTHPSKPPSPATPTVPQVILPDRNKNPPTNIYPDEAEDEIHPIAPPGRQQLPTLEAASTTLHWRSQSEHFPVPTESIIQLPTGIAASIPKIQHAFDDETPDAKINREKRQSKVKEEFKKAWTGYRKNAWLHDELSPVTGKFRDPFCGWAATLVDSLDTLWIMGLHEEFEEAARAVNLIDFTTSPRSDIPMFETTIRYLGGLVAAYDVSGGRYKNLLDKAVELADVLMGAFDTPNRMPVLYYHWMPDFASQPHRAGQRSNTAELGSLSLEFTRLAQLTREPRYYDAVARITNGLSDLQDRGTDLPGVFPDSIDASGCNRTVQLTPQEPINSNDPKSFTSSRMQHAADGFRSNSPETSPEPRPKENEDELSRGRETREVQILPGEVSKARIVEYDSFSKRDVPQKARNQDSDGNTSSNKTLSAVSTNPQPGTSVDLPKAKAQLGVYLGDWDCVPQGLDSAPSYGMSKFSMGGGQDSTYEYFPKQYLLLGGREEKYKKMYLRTIDAVKKYMLFRPMVPTNRDILMSGTVSTRGHPEEDAILNAEHEHLTCFIGGMVGMAAKVFDLEDDLELAKRLADGCVWSYEVTDSGIMPESGIVVPCKSVDHCPWNETAYRDQIDPVGPERDRRVAEYVANKDARAKEAEDAKIAVAAAARAKAEAVDAQTRFNDVEFSEGSLHHASGDHEGDVDYQSLSNSTSAAVGVRKRQITASGLDGMKPSMQEFKDKAEEGKARYEADRKQKFAVPKGDIPRVSDLSNSPSLQQTRHQDKYEAAGLEMLEITTGRQAEVPLSFPPQLSEDALDTMMPQSHKEYVDERIQLETLPKGYVRIQSRKYILRPEAIESVFYMHRITGSPVWAEKGWRMFEAIIKATSTTYGHSALADVTDKKPYKMDEMESFWLAETLKYFYLLYSTPDTVSLDEWVLNTEAHPFKRGS